MKRFFLNFFFLIGLSTPSSLQMFLNAIAPESYLPEKTSQKLLSDVLVNFNSKNSITQYAYTKGNFFYFDSFEKKDLTSLRILRNTPSSMTKIIQYVLEKYDSISNHLRNIIQESPMNHIHLPPKLIKIYYYQIQHLLLLGFCDRASELYNIIERHYFSYHLNCIPIDKVYLYCLKIHKILEAEELRSSSVKIRYTQYMKSSSPSPKSLYDSLKDADEVSIQFYKGQGFFEFNTHESLKFFLYQMHPIFWKYLQYSEKSSLKIHSPLLKQDNNGNIFIDLFKIPPALHQYFYSFLKRASLLTSPPSSHFFLKKTIVLQKSSQKIHTEISKQWKNQQVSLSKNFVFLKGKSSGAQSGGIYSEIDDKNRIWIIKSADMRGGGTINSSHAIREVAGAGLLKKMDIRIPETKIVLDRTKNNLLVGSRYQEGVFFFQDLHILNRSHKVNRKPLQKMMLVAFLTGHDDFFSSINGNLLFQFNERTQLYEPIMIDLASIFFPKTLEKTIDALKNDTPLKELLLYSSFFQGHYYGLKDFIWEGVSEQEMYKMALSVTKELNHIFNKKFLDNYFDYELQFENKEKFSSEIEEVKKSFCYYQIVKKFFHENYEKNYLIDNEMHLYCNEMTNPERYICKFSNPIVRQKMIDFCKKHFNGFCQNSFEDSNHMIIDKTILHSPKFIKALGGLDSFTSEKSSKMHLTILPDFAFFKFIGLSIQYDSNDLFFIRNFLKKLLKTQKKVFLKTTHSTFILSEKNFDKQLKMFSHRKVKVILMDSTNTSFEFLQNENLLSCA